MKLPHAAELSENTTYWLAGLLDGEGCFDNPRGNPRIRLKMTDFDIILRASDVMGGPVHQDHYYGPHSGTKEQFVTSVHGDAAISVMRAVLPVLGDRRSAKVKEIVAEYAAKKSGKIRLLRLAAA